MTKEYLRQKIRVARLPDDRSRRLLLYSLPQAGIAHLFVAGFKEIQCFSADLAEYHLNTGFLSSLNYETRNRLIEKWKPPFRILP